MHHSGMSGRWDRSISPGQGKLKHKERPVGRSFFTRANPPVPRNRGDFLQKNQGDGDIPSTFADAGGGTMGTVKNRPFPGGFLGKFLKMSKKESLSQIIIA